jgi:hypothetical protein
VLPTINKILCRSRPVKWYPNLNPLIDLPFPLTAVEVHNRVGGTSIEFGPELSRIGGVTISGAFVAYGAVALSVS